MLLKCLGITVHVASMPSPSDSPQGLSGGGPHGRGRDSPPAKGSLLSGESQQFGGLLKKSFSILDGELGSQ